MFFEDQGEKKERKDESCFACGSDSDDDCF